MLTGCGYRHIAALENGGQSFIDIKANPDTSVALETLAPKDSVVVADDGGNLITAATNDVHVVMVEPESIPIGLGIPDFDLRFGWALGRGKTPDQAQEKRFALAAVKEVALQADRWQQQGHHELSQEQILQGRVPVVFRVIAYNAGNREFQGAMGFNDRLAVNVEFDKVLSTRKVADVSMAKALMSLVPILGIFAADMDRFQPVANAAVQTQTTFDRATGVLRHQITPIQLTPGEGVEIRFAAHVLLPRDEALLKARMKPPVQR
ncbi:hypothetical protein [Acidovorax sp. MR-S7]|uniref:hypothetical protein n=1 Tax=Acidovorax sp. MR-S7 TaxID=1268622 RepID=UPI0003617B77|nr:hypothetical protein [Acidovorax sp. MR-S7]GAD23239.1 hypothetical protein AVS7_02999 [Acidovorax sp. MR-S7]